MDAFKALFNPNLPSVTSAEAQALLKSAEPPFVLDVREPEEFREGHLAGAKLIPLGELGERLAELPQGRTILCVCHSGSRSSAAARHLIRSGYTVLNMRGGMAAWQLSGLPVKR